METRNQRENALFSAFNVRIDVRPRLCRNEISLPLPVLTAGNGYPQVPRQKCHYWQWRCWGCVCGARAAAPLQVRFTPAHSHHSRWELSQGSNYFHLVKEGCTWHRCLLAFSTLNGPSPPGSMMGLSTEGRGSIPACTLPFRANLYAAKNLRYFSTLWIGYLEKRFDVGICCPFYLEQSGRAGHHVP